MTSVENNDEELDKLKQKLRARIAEMRAKRKADQTVERKRLKQIQQAELPVASPKAKRERKRKAKKETKQEAIGEKPAESDGDTSHSDADLTPKRIALDASLDEVRAFSYIRRDSTVG